MGGGSIPPQTHFTPTPSSICKIDLILRKLTDVLCSTSMASTGFKMRDYGFYGIHVHDGGGVFMIITTRFVNLFFIFR